MEIFNAPKDSMTAAIDGFIVPRGITIEEGVVVGRVFNKNPIDASKAGVNSDSSSEQSLWNGQYQVKLRRGFGIPAVYCTGTFGRGIHEQECLVYGESVCVMWLDRNATPVPVIMKGSSLEFYQKLLTGKGHLLDCGEKVFRAAISQKPEATRLSGFPFADNQIDNPQSAPLSDGAFDPNTGKVIQQPGGELFCDKFGRALLTSRHLGHEFIVTLGKTDSGQDDSSSLTTKEAQNFYYGKIKNDESSPINDKEPFAPKPLNLIQYQLLQSQVKDSNGKQQTAGYLPRFDLWKFQPVIVRQFSEGTDGSKLSGDVYSVYQLRGNATDGNAYAFTVTQKGDVKEFVARHLNQRIVGDCLVSVGGNYNLRVRKTGNSDSAATFDFYVKQNGDTNLMTKTKLDINVTGTMTITSDKLTGTIAKDVAIASSGAGIALTSKTGVILKSGTLPVIPALEPMVLGQTLKTFLDSFFTMMASWVPVPMDGGLALKTMYMTWYSAQKPALDMYLSGLNQVN